MIIMYNKSFEQLVHETEDELKQIGISTTPGSIAKLLLNIVNKHLSTYYETLQINHLNAFISTASEEALDAIGVLLNCSRNDNEDDDNYRFRITQQTLNLAKANETSVRLAALSVEGVQDVILKNNSHGAGTFSLYVITDKEQADETLLINVRNRVNDVVGYGIKFYILNPDLLKVKIKIKLITDETIDEIGLSDYKFIVVQELRKYFTSIPIGEPIITNELTKLIMNVNDNIKDYVCIDFKINNKKAIYTNQYCNWNQRFILSNDPDSIIVI